MAYRISTKGESKRFYMEDLDSSRKPEPYPNQYIIAKEHSNGNILVLSVMGASDGRPFPFSTSVGFPYTDFRDGNNSDATFASVQEVLDWFDDNTGFKRAGRSALTTDIFNPNLIELAGQSNALGFELLTNKPTGLTFTRGGAYISKGGKNFSGVPVTIETLSNSTAWGWYDSNVNSTYGIEMALMKLLTEHYDEDFYLIKTAMGGTGLESILGNDPTNATCDWNIDSINDLYDQSNQHHDDAVALIPGEDAPAYYIWIQGETDIARNDLATYQENLEAFIDVKRTYYNRPKMPFIIVRIGDQMSYFTETQRNNLRAIQETVAAQPYNVLIDADGATMKDDNLHYNAAGLDLIAKRIADYMGVDVVFNNVEPHDPLDKFPLGFPVSSDDTNDISGLSYILGSVSVESWIMDGEDVNSIMTKSEGGMSVAQITITGLTPNVPITIQVRGYEAMPSAFGRVSIPNAGITSGTDVFQTIDGATFANYSINVTPIGSTMNMELRSNSNTPGDFCLWSKVKIFEQ
ncbi:hypothetical protein C7967_11564 [Thalassospira sp. 11-3]|nr:hypothetical protein C7967_11564 [Thalassospira sp. 11-3]